jgi:hypothetical protein
MSTKKTKRFAILALLIVLAVSGMAGPRTIQAAPDAQASDEQVQLLDFVTGTLDPATPALSYTLQLVHDMVFSIVVSQQSGTLIPELEVIDPGGTPIYTGTPLTSDGSVKVLEAAYAPLDGLYTVRVLRSGDTSGEFAMTLLPGYSSLDRYEDFEAGTSDDFALTWEPYMSENVIGEVNTGAMQIQVLTDDLVGYMAPEDDLIWTDMYIEAQIEILESPSYY